MKYEETKEDYDYDASVENTPEKNHKSYRNKKLKGRRLAFDGTLLSGNTCNGNNSVYNNKKDDDSVRDVVVEPEFPTLILDLEQISTIVVEDFLAKRFEHFFKRQIIRLNLVFADAKSELEYRDNLYKELFESGKRRFFDLLEKEHDSLKEAIQKLTNCTDITGIMNKIIIYNRSVASFASISALHSQQEDKELSVVLTPEPVPLRKPQPIRFNSRKNAINNKTTGAELIEVREKLQLLNI